MSRSICIFTKTSLISGGSTCGLVPCGTQYSKGISFEDNWGDSERTRKWLRLTASLFSPHPRTARLLMSKSMCGCGCSIISSLMKRLGRTACCSDLLSCSHTSEQLQRLATACPPRPKVIVCQLPLTQSRHVSGDTGIVLFVSNSRTI